MRTSIVERRWSACAGLYVALWASVAAAQTSSAYELVPPRWGERYQENEQLVVIVTNVADSAAALAVEVDGVDVTSVLQVDGRRFSYTPVTALEPGEHELVLYRLQSDDVAVVLAEWSFEVGSIADEHEAAGWSARAHSELDTTYRVDESGYEYLGERLSVSGAGETLLQAEVGRLSAQLRSNYFLERNALDAPTGRHADIGEYELAARYTHEHVIVSGRLGDQSLSYDTLLTRDYRSRGATLALSAASGRVDVQGMALRTAPVVGSQPMLGIGSPSQRLEGISVGLRPLETRAGGIRIRSTYFTGEGATIGFAQEGDALDSSGDGAGVALESEWFDDRLRLGAEYARTHYDVDGAGAGVSAQSDHAMAFKLGFAPIDGRRATSSLQELQFGLEYERIGTFFHSLANPTLRPDRASTRGFSAFAWGNVSGGLDLYRETNNVNDLSIYTTDRLSNYQLGLTYQHSAAWGSQQSRWLGTPFITVNASATDLSRLKTPTDYEGPTLDQEIGSLSLSAGSALDTWSWALTYGYNRMDDRGDLQLQSRSRLLGLQLSGWLFDALSWSSSAQRELVREQLTGETSKRWIWNNSLSMSALDGRFNAALNHALDRSSGSEDHPTRAVLNGELSWTLLTPLANRLGITLGLAGVAEFGSSGVAELAGQDRHQLFVILRLVAPLSWQPDRF